jgi:MHS family alpha-ketoglutarate permease-like MFS transporter
MSLTLGLLIASVLGWVLSSSLNTEQLSSWGWRLPFLLGALAALWGYYLRRSVEESEVFVSARTQSAERPVQSAPRSRATLSVLRVIGMTGLGSITFWTLTSYLPSHAHELGIPSGQVFGASTFALLIFLLLQPVVGWLSDRVGRKPLLIGYAAGFVVLSYPLIAGIRLTSGLTLFLVMLLGLVVFSGYSAISAAFLAEQFPTRSRSTGVGIAHNVSSALFGGTAPYLLARLTEGGHEAWFAAYVILAAVISGVLFSQISEARGKALPQ